MTKEQCILIVDDDDANQTFISEILEQEGYAYRIAANGQQALAAMRESKPDLVLLDVMMPRKSGTVVYTEMKQDPDLLSVPIVFVTGASDLTGVDMQTGEQQAKEGYGDDMARRVGDALHQQISNADADGFIEKPIDPQKLADTVRKVLS
jgi:CheY-like chemotaxis protein